MAELKRGPSYDDMVKIIQGGGSVMVNGKVVTKLSGLPQPIELAGTPEEKQQAKADLIAERDRINALLGEEGATETTEGGVVVPKTADAAADDGSADDGDGALVEPDLSLPDGADAEAAADGETDGEGSKKKAAGK